MFENLIEIAKADDMSKYIVQIRLPPDYHWRTVSERRLPVAAFYSDPDARRGIQSAALLRAMDRQQLLLYEFNSQREHLE